MELQHPELPSRAGNFDLSSGTVKWRWVSNKWSVTIGLVALMLLLSIGLFFGGYYTGLRASTDNLQNEILPDDTAQPFTKLPDLQWEDVCPRKNSKCPESYEGIPPLILISLDGFRPDYLKRGITPTLSNISQCGTRAEYMYPAFPSKTFPNHFTIVTGVYPAYHGIIDNNMYDPVNGKSFKVGTAESRKSYWWEKEPVWVTAQKQGKKSACYFWPGSEVPINNTLPTYFKKYSSKIPFESRVDTILSWLDLPVEKRPSFLTLYFNQPDNAAHHFGILSKEVNDALIKVDKVINRLFAGLQQRNLLNCVNVIVLSDHGMVDVNCKQMIKLQDFINVSEIYSTLGAFGRIRPKGKKNLTVIENLVSSLQCKNEHMRVYLKEQLPVRCHFSEHRRIEPIYLDLDAGWTVSNRDNNDDANSFCSGANHGYDNYFPEMQALFMAHGPSFKFNHTVKPFLNVELYELISELINITSTPNNGTKGSLHHLLTKPKILPPQKSFESPPIAQVPSSKKEYEFRVYAANCTCSQEKMQENMENVTELSLEHLPFGMPFSPADNATLHLLYHSDYIGAFDVKYRLPMWTAYSLSRNVTLADEKPCWKGDARISIDSTSKCGDYNVSLVADEGILQRPAFPLDFASTGHKEEASLVTNSVPKYTNNVYIIEKALNQMIASLVRFKGSINVITGPAFDVNATGLRPDIGDIMQIHAKYGPLVVPTHYFNIITWCREKNVFVKDCNATDLDVLAFLVPNVPIAYNCEAPKDLIKKHAARVVDIEILTGITFFTKLPTYEAIRLRTSFADTCNS